MTKPYLPKGKILRLLVAMKDEPEREFTSKDAALVMRCNLKAVGSSTEYAISAGMIFRRKLSGYRGLVFRGTPFPEVAPDPNAPRKHPERPVIRNGWATDPDDPRIGKVVPGWVPPKMVCTRTVV